MLRLKFFFHYFCCVSLVILVSETKLQTQKKNKQYQFILLSITKNQKNEKYLSSKIVLVADF